MNTDQIQLLLNDVKKIEQRIGNCKNRQVWGMFAKEPLGNDSYLLSQEVCNNILIDLEHEKEIITKEIAKLIV